MKHRGSRDSFRQKQIFLKNILPLLGAFLGATVFFIGYNNYLLDKTLANLKVSLKQLDTEKGREVAKLVGDILDDTFIMEIAKEEIDAVTLAKIEFSSQIVNKVSQGEDEAMLSDAIDFLSSIIERKSKGRSPFLNTLDNVLTNLNPKAREESKRTLERKIDQLKNDVKNKEGAEAQKVHLEIARTYVLTRDWKQALYHIDEVVKIDSESSIAKEALFYSGVVHKLNGDYFQAKEIFNQVKNDLTGELSALSYFEEGDSLYRMGQLEEATNVFEEAFRMNPKLEVAQIAQFRAGYIKIYDLERIKSFDEAFAGKPSIAFDKIADFEAGDIIEFYDLKEERNIRENFLTLAKQEPQSQIIPEISRAYRNRGFALAKQGHSLMRQGRYAEATGRFIFSEEQFNLALEIEKDDPISHSGKSISLLHLRNKEAALSEALRAKTLGPDVPLVLANLGYVYSQLQMFSEAFEEYNNAYALNPESGSLNYNIGTLYLIQGDYKKALEYLVKAQMINPDFAPTQNNIGYVYSKEKRYQDAKVAFERSTYIQEDNIESHYNLGVLLFALERYDDARVQFTRVRGLRSVYRRTEWFLDEISIRERSYEE
jgi:tetratricopeptide (TPR) repeat protein